MTVSCDEGTAVRGAAEVSVRWPGAAREETTREMADVLFASFARSDQRRKGEQYLRGMLSTPGRKSIRNIAAHVKGAATEQSLHHFISSSTWDWRPVRQALAGLLTRIGPPEAWVVHPMPIPKAGDLSVGVDQGFDPCLGAFRGQRAFGVWYGSRTLNSPVNWRLFLSGSWVQDPVRRRQAEIPEGIREETLEECAATAALDVLSSWDVPSRPVVLNTHIAHAAATMGRFTAAGVPVIARIDGTARLTVHDPALPGRGSAPTPAGLIAAAAMRLRRGVEWADEPGAYRESRGTLTAAVRVGAEGGGRSGADPYRGELLLLGEWDGAGHAPQALWVTNMTSAPAPALLRLTRLGGRACRDLAAAGEDVGLKDFEGRSFNGWHRHITLASAAHAVAALSGPRSVSGGRGPRSA
ncbi:IS701 family transposase [Streptomyces rubiginosohelvolus]|uniref:IS701 family transposase n=1 Tax=Streptomyces rubiginosohelvolus TaxID=67362 RepID=UPI0034047D71